MPTQSKGQVHDVFTAATTDLAAQAASWAEALRGRGQRTWNAPTTARWPGDVLDVPGMTTPFDRAEINANYEATIASGAAPGTAGDAVSLKTQGDYVAVCERAFRARHCTPVRLLAMTAARRAGHGDAAGVFNTAVRYAQNALRSGQE